MRDFYLTETLLYQQKSQTCHIDGAAVHEVKSISNCVYNFDGDLFALHIYIYIYIYLFIYLFFYPHFPYGLDMLIFYSSINEKKWFSKV